MTAALNSEDGEYTLKFRDKGDALKQALALDSYVKGEEAALRAMRDEEQTEMETLTQRPEGAPPPINAKEAQAAAQAILEQRVHHRAAETEDKSDKPALTAVAGGKG